MSQGQLLLLAAKNAGWYKPEKNHFATDTYTDFNAQSILGIVSTKCL